MFFSPLTNLAATLFKKVCIAGFSLLGDGKEPTPLAENLLTPSHLEKLTPVYLNPNQTFVLPPKINFPH